MYTLLLLAASAAVVALTWGLVLWRLGFGGNDAYGMCAPSRHAAITGSTAQPARRIVAELAPPAGWRDVRHVAILAEPARVEYADEPAELPIAVENWPLPAVVEPEPVPVVVDRWARFSALEVTGK